MAIDRYTVEERCTKITLKRGFTVVSFLRGLIYTLVFLFDNTQL